MKRIKESIAVLLLAIAPTVAQIVVNPTGVNVNSQNPTTVFLTFGQLPPDYIPAEAIWCGELIPAVPPAIGRQCRPDTIYGSLPIRYDRSTASGSSGFTDIMAIPPAVVRRAYQAAVAGASAGFFYVRRFVSKIGNPDQFVNVTCRMTGGGARVPFALTNVEIKTPSGEPVLFLNAGDKFPKLKAGIQYNGTGRLKGRWEIVQPGEDLPEDRDLLTEATLPIEERGTQRRYTQVARFNHFLPPAGKFELEVAMGDRVPTVAGQYLLLLRIEAVDDKESDSNLAAVGVGPGVVHSGAVASFPMPSFKFFVTGNSLRDWAASALLSPGENHSLLVTDLLPVFTWRPLKDAAFYRIEFFEDASAPRFQAILPASITVYRVPSMLLTWFSGGTIKWKVIALDDKGSKVAESAARTIRFE